MGIFVKAAACSRISKIDNTHTRGAWIGDLVHTEYRLISE